MTGDNDGGRWPLAWFLTFTLYGHWLHSDERGSVDRFHSTPDEPRVKPNAARHGYEQTLAGPAAPYLSPEMRASVTAAIREVCETRQWVLHAINVRTNHVHVVATGNVKAEVMMTTFKAYATRALRAAGLIGGGERMWTRHGSTRAVWNEQSLQNVWEYVTNMQDHE
jgi:REP element-mobilizing transposase RayT